jgi:hypothetical protein
METPRLGVVANAITSFLAGISGFPSFTGIPMLSQMRIDYGSRSEQPSKQGMINLEITGIIKMVQYE